MMTSDISDLEEFAWNRAQTKISIFSAQQYVENYLTPPFQAAGYVNLNFIDVSASAEQGARCSSRCEIAGGCKQLLGVWVCFCC